MTMITLILCTLLLSGCNKSELSELPKPEITEGIRGTQFGIDKNINEEINVKTYKNSPLVKKKF